MTPPAMPPARRIFKIFSAVTSAKPWHYGVPMLLAILAAALEGAAMALLLPLANGLAKDDFSFLWQIRGIRAFHARFPDAFNSATSPNRSAFVFIVLILFGTSVGSLLFSYLAARTSAWRDGTYTARVKAFTLARCLSFGKQYFDRVSQATVGDMIGYSEAVLRILTLIERAVDQGFRLVVQVTVMVAISWPLTLFMALALPVLRLLDRWIVRRCHAVAERATTAEATFSRQVYNVLSCIPLVKAFALEERTQRTYVDLVDKMRVLHLARERARLAAAPLQQAVTLCTLLVVVCLAIALTPSDHTADLAVVCAFLLVSRRAVPLLGFATELRLGYAQYRPYLERLATVFDDADKSFVAGGPRSFGGLTRGIEVRDLWFSYVDDVEVLRGLSCVIPAGRTTALVGETGCGKTTAASLLARLYECPPGTIFVDGVDIREFSRTSLAAHIAFVGQEAWLFNDSLRANLVVGLDRSADDGELLEMLDRVRLGRLIAGLPGGLDTEIGDRGLRLSGGEKQRLCIARALLRRASLIVLDEATASLDSHTERDVLDVLERATRGQTVIAIAHRLSTIRHADQILVLSRGRVVQSGTWPQLVNQAGPFAAMWEVQTQVGPEPALPN